MDDSKATQRLERLWAGEFGDEYASRNAEAAAGRGGFWKQLLSGHEIASALEVGCNVGGNLVWLVDLLGAENVAGVDLNESALEVAAAAVPGADLRRASAYELPFEDAAFDLVFTTGVLIHLPPGDVEAAMKEVVRCSRRFVLCGEYFSEELAEVPYRGLEGALFKQDFGALYTSEHPQLEPLDRGFLPASEGVWDDVTWWLFEKR